MAENEETLFNAHPNLITYKYSKKIMEQMERNICKINIGNLKGTGFFCKIPFPNQNKMLPVLITNNHIINNDLLNNEKIKLELYKNREDNIKEIILNNRMKYTNEEYNITIIEIKKR